jgi:hypothetical protein
MNKSLKTVKVQIPSYEDSYKSDYLDFGTIFSTNNIIKNYFLDLNSKKQELFNDYKEYKEFLNANKLKLTVNEISVENYVEEEFKIVKKIKDKYKLDIEKLIKIYFNEPLKNSYEYNLSRGIEQNFVKLSTLLHSSNGESRIETNYLVYEENKFELTIGDIYINEISYVEL